MRTHDIEDKKNNNDNKENNTNIVKITKSLMNCHLLKV